MAFFRKFDLLVHDVVLVGCGGTGSRVIPPLVQELKQAVTAINPCLYLVDGDIVENKNLSRQNFINRDIGRNKAIVMAERYGAALDFPIVAVPEYIESELDYVVNNYAEEQSRRKMGTMRKLVILCVDSIQARLDILGLCNPGDVIIDAGNEDTFGQVSIFDTVSLPHIPGDYKDQNVVIKPFLGDYALPFIPAPISQYIHAINNPSPATGSCADLDQSLAVNFMMAAGIIAMVQGIMYNNEFHCRTNYFDIIKGNSSERMTNTWFSQVFNEPACEINYEIRDISIKTIGLLPECMKGAKCNRDSVTTLLVNDLNKKVKYVDPALLAALGK